MNFKEVPDDHNQIYEGYGTKLVYAISNSGSYLPVHTTGWSVEEIVLRDVLDVFKDKAEKARIRALAGEISPIEYYMHKNMLDLPSLSYGLGMFQWRIKRHFRPSVFKKLNSKIRMRYAEFFKISIEELNQWLT